MTRITALLSQRPLQFLTLGSLLFALSPREDDHRIEISSRALRGLHAEQAARLGKGELSPEEERTVDARAIEDEVLVREARRLGLDEDDAIIRARLVQKMLFLAEELDGASVLPTDSELRAYFEANPERYERDGKITFVHIFARSEEEAASLRDEAEAFSAESEDPAAIPPLGAPMPISRRATLGDSAIARSYGADFARALRSAPERSWVGPVASSYGWHLARVIAREEAGTPRLEEIEGEVRMDAIIARREAAVARFLDGALSRYELTVDGEPMGPLTRSPRSAPRTQPSLEDQP